LRALRRGLIAFIAAALLIFTLPPTGISIGKYGFAAAAGIGVMLAGVLQLRLLRNSSEVPLKGVGIGAALRGVIVVGLIVAAKFSVPAAELNGCALATLVAYLAVQITEIPLLTSALRSGKSDSSS